VPLKEIPGYKERLKVRPGLTGLAQVYLPADAPRKDKFRYDVFYIKRQSLSHLGENGRKKRSKALV